MEQPRKKMCTRNILESLLPKEITSKCMDMADTERFETMEYWKEISKQTHLERFPIGSKIDRVSWDSWVGENRWEPEYSVEPCQNCKSPCSIYNDKVYHYIGYTGNFCSYECMMDGHCFDYLKYEKMKNKYA